MRRADGRAFVVDAAGSAEITDASSAFLRALASAGTAPPRASPSSSPSPEGPGPSVAADAPRLALPAPEPTTTRRPRTRSATSRAREYFPRANRLYEALTGARRRREDPVPRGPAPFQTHQTGSSPPPATAPLSAQSDAPRDPRPDSVLSPGSLDRRLSLDHRHVGDITGLRRRRRRLEWRASDGRRERDGDDGEGRRETDGDAASATFSVARAAEATETAAAHADARGPRGGLDIARVARELGESLRATNRGALDVPTGEDGEDGEEREDGDVRDVGRRRNLRARVAFLADALLTILREVDARLEAPEGDDDSLGRYVGLLGLGANGPLEARDLAALAPTTTWRDWVPVAAAPGEASPHAASDPDAANAAKRDRPGATLPTFYGARGSDGDCCDAPQCYVCLEAFRGGEEIRELPCRHAFHRACVDKWLLRSSRKCPTCRAEVPRAPRRFDAADEFGNPTSRNPASVGSPASATLQPRGGVLALPPTRPNLFFLPAPEGFEPGAVPERVASPAPRTRA